MPVAFSRISSATRRRYSSPRGRRLSLFSRSAQSASPRANRGRKAGALMERRASFRAAELLSLLQDKKWPAEDLDYSAKVMDLDVSTANAFSALAANLALPKA